MQIGPTVHRYMLADVFTDRVFGGNPLAVFPDGEGIGEDVMRALARELNLSETVFVLPAADPTHACRLRIFTPGMELPFAGHPTVGTACVLAETGRLGLEAGETRVVFEEGVGPIVVDVRRDERGCAAWFEVRRELEVREAPPAPDVAAMLSLPASALTDDPRAPVAASYGVPFVLVELGDVATLGRVRVDVGRWQTLLAEHWAPHVYVFVAPGAHGSAIRARMFAPAMNIAEDPATGAAAAALAGHLGGRDARADAQLQWTIEQGIEMGRPSRIEVEAVKEGGSVVAVRVGGRTVLVGEGAFDVRAHDRRRSASPDTTTGAGR